ncbi:MAG: ABC transporter ATP-binding protein [Gemmataceae bacterium]
MLRIALQDASLTFRLHKRGSTSVKDFVLQKLLRRPGPPQPVVEALKQVSFEVHEGQRLGIIGHNGAGKSTLLRLLAGVYQPTSGSIHVQGKISSMFELSLGFEPDATGWENIRYRGYLLRQSPETIAAKMKSISEFTELGPALDMPIRYYSAGMLVRLAFAITTSIEPEILLIDEVLAAGDMAFMEKAKRRIHDLIKQAKAMVMVSHDLVTLGKMCDRVIWLDHGEVKQMGPAQETIQAYQRFMHNLVKRQAAA